MNAKIAAIQMVSTCSVAENIKSARRLISDAVGQGAEMVLLPEYWSAFAAEDCDNRSNAEKPDNGPVQSFMSEIAKEYGIWLIGGTLPLVSALDDKLFNSMLVYNPDGIMVSRYDKVHLFSFKSENEFYDESKIFEPGKGVETFEAPFGRVGLSVCYDLRFPELYRAMGDCTLMVVPAAFAYTTGKAHWEVLLRARAIENQCYLLAACQGGQHANGRRTYGHSMFINPWGEIVGSLDEGEGVVAGNISISEMNKIRDKLPALKHIRIR